MKGTISVMEALDKRDRMIGRPSIGIFLAVWIGTGFILCICGINVAFSSIIGFVGAIIVVALFSAYMSPKWRLWAFRNVIDVHGLQQAAIAEGFLSADKAWWENLPVESAAQKAAWKQLQERFKEPNIFIDDPTVADETEVIATKTSLRYFGLAIAIILLIVGLVTIGQFQSIFINLLIIAAAGVVGGVALQTPKKATRVVINSKGINTEETGLVIWDDIKGEKTYTTGGKNSRTYLQFQGPTGNMEADITDMDMADRKLRHLMYIYRHRSELQ